MGAYSAYRMEEHTKSLNKKKKWFDLKKDRTGAAIKHHWTIVECAYKVVRMNIGTFAWSSAWSRKENISAILVDGANKQKKQVNYVK